MIVFPAYLQGCQIVQKLNFSTKLRLLHIKQQIDTSVFIYSVSLNFSIFFSTTNFHLVIFAKSRRLWECAISERVQSDYIFHFSLSLKTVDLFLKNVFFFCHWLPE